jgi:hypothetical protein
MMWTEEQKSLCVTGTPLYAGTAMEEVTPGTTSEGFIIMKKTVPM